jgi:hypothetical protein
MKINHAMINRMGACWDKEDWRLLFGDVVDVEITPENARQYSRGVNWYWLASQLLTRDDYFKFSTTVDTRHGEYYKERNEVRNRFSDLLLVCYRERESHPDHEEFQRQMKAVQKKSDDLYADNFMELYMGNKEYADSILTWASSESSERGPHGGLQYGFYDTLDNV